MIIDAVVVTHPTLVDIFPSSTGNIMLRAEIQCSESGSQDITDLIFNLGDMTAGGETNIANIKLWYTGNTPTFTSPILHGTTGGSPAFGDNAITPTTPITLVAGSNYIWFTYDIISNTSCNNILDCNLVMFIINSGANEPYDPAWWAGWGTPTFNGDPAGNRIINMMSGALPVTGSSNVSCQSSISWTEGSADLYISTDPLIATNRPAPVSVAGTSVLISTLDLDCATEYFWFVIPLANAWDCPLVQVNSFTTQDCPTIATPPVNTEECEGNGSMIFVQTTESPANYTFQWRRGGVNLVEDYHFGGSTTTFALTFTPVLATDGGSYDCVISSGCGSITTTPVTFTVGAVPVITLQPIGIVVNLDGTAVFTITATNAIEYGWRKNGVLLVNGGNISGATTNTLTITNVSVGDIGDYDCYAKNSCLVVFSETAFLLTNPFAPTSEPVCCFDPPIDLSLFLTCEICTPAQLAVSYWTGHGVIGNEFYPSVAGVGSHSLTYNTPLGNTTITVVVENCDPANAQLAILRCCIADKTYEAVNLASKGLKTASLEMYERVAILNLLFDYLSCYSPDSVAIFPSWEAEVTIVAGGADVYLTYGDYEWAGFSFTTGIAAMNNMVSTINTSGTGFVASFVDGVFTVIAPSCLFSGTAVLTVLGSVSIVSQSSSFSGGHCAVVNCLTEKKVDNMWATIKDICGCDCRSTKNLADDTVVLSGGRKYNFRLN